MATIYCVDNETRAGWEWDTDAAEWWGTLAIEVAGTYDEGTNSY
jgi:hypothetical protein